MLIADLISFNGTSFPQEGAARANESAYIWGKCKRLQMTGQVIYVIVIKSLSLVGRPELAGSDRSIAIEGIDADIIDRHC